MATILEAVIWLYIAWKFDELRPSNSGFYEGRWSTPPRRSALGSV